jgi:HlyD family secretion protein
VNRRIWRIAKGVVLVGCLLALAAVALAFFLRPIPVTVARVSVRDLAPAVQGVGTVEAKLVVQIGAKITGRVIAVLADQGDTVRPGQVLVRLEDTEQAAQADQSQAAVLRARLTVTAQEAALKKAQAALGAAEAAVARVRATEALTRVNAARWRQLHADGGVSRADMDARVTEALAAGEELKNIEAQRQSAGEEVAFLKANLEAVRQDIRVAEAALAAARARQGDTVVRSPLAGVVVSRDLEPGATVGPGTSILKIADPQTVWVTVHVDERETGAIAVGDSAEVALRSLPGRNLPGRIVRIRRESDRVTEQLAVDIAFEERPPRLTLGEQAEATIRSQGQQGAVALPLAALIRTPDGPAAFAVKNGRLQFRTLRIGVADPAGWVQVLDGFRAGEDVVLAPGHLADPKNDGRRVRIVSAKTTTDNAK